MSQAKSKSVEPSIDDMLNTIREAIHEETARETRKAAPVAPAPKPEMPRSPGLQPPEASRTRSGSGVSGSMRELRVSLQPSENASSPGTVTARSSDFMSLKSKLASLRQPQSSGGSGPIAGVMAGDLRLEDALSGINTAERLQRPNNPAMSPAQPRQPAPPPKLAQAAPVARTEPQLQSPPRHEPATPAPALARAAATPAEPVLRPTLQPSAIAAEVRDHTAAEPGDVSPVSEPPRVAEAPAKQTEASTLPTAEIAGAQAPVPVAKPERAERPPLMSAEALDAAAGAFERLSRELFRSEEGGEQALEDTARDMVRPMLKRWLDENLPALVERLVREEIERVARRGGR